METNGRLTNTELGRRIGVGFSMASRLRSGDRAPGPATMRRICEEFGIPAEDMLAARAQGAGATGQLLRKYIEA